MPRYKEPIFLYSEEPPENSVRYQLIIMGLFFLGGVIVGIYAMGMLV